MQDYRAESYRKIAKESSILSKKARRRAAEKLAANLQAIANTDISIKPEYITTSTTSNQKAITGIIQENAEIKPKLEKTTATTTTNTQQQGTESKANTLTPTVERGYERVYVSEGVARKLDPNIKGTSKDSVFYVDVSRGEQTTTTTTTQKKVYGEDTLANPESYFTTETQRRKDSRRQKFTIAKQRVLPVITSGDSNFVQKGGAIVQAAGLYTFKIGQEAASLVTDRIYSKDGTIYVGGELLVAGGVGLTSYASPKVSSVVDPKAITVEVNSIVKQESNYGGSVSQGKLLPGSTVNVKYKSFGVVPRQKSYSVTGSFQETTKNTGLVGRQSGEAIYSTKGSGEYVLRGVSGSQKATVSVATKGSEVAYIGNRRVSVSTSSATGLNQQGFVERYVGNSKAGGEVVYGGSVSSKGQGVYVGQRAISYPSTRYRPVVNTVDRTVSVVEYPSTTSIYNVKGAAQNTPVSYRGLNTQFVDVSIYSKLLSEQPLPVGKVSSVAREQALSSGGGVGVSNVVQYPTTTSIFNQKAIIKSSAELVTKSQPSPTITATPVVSPLTTRSSSASPVNVRVDSVDVSVSKTSPTLDYGVGSSSIAFSKPSSIVSPVSRLDSLIGSASRSKSRVGQVSKSASLPITGTVPISIQSSIVETASSSASKQQTQSLLRNVQVQRKVPAAIFRPVNPPLFTPKVPAFGSNGLLLGGKNVFGVEVRRFGRFRDVGRFGSLKAAVGRGVDVVRRGLGATFRIKSRSRFVNPGKVGSQFYTKQSGEVVQLPKFRLGTGGERSEIQFFKRRSRR